MIIARNILTVIFVALALAFGALAMVPHYVNAESTVVPASFEAPKKAERTIVYGFGSACPMRPEFLVNAPCSEYAGPINVVEGSLEPGIAVEAICDPIFDPHPCMFRPDSSLGIALFGGGKSIKWDGKNPSN